MRKMINMSDQKEITLKEGFTKFIEYQIALKGSKEPIVFYTTRYRYFEEFIGEHIQASELNEDICIKYITYLTNNKNLNNISINNYLRGIRTIANHLIDKKKQTHRMKKPYIISQNVRFCR